MSVTSRRCKLGFVGGAVAVLFAMAAPLDSALAEEQPSAEQIIKALKPRVTRSLSASPTDNARAAEEAQFIESLRHRTTRSLATAEREKIATIAENKPKIDLEINFEYNSAIIGSKALPQVNALGQALTSADLKGGTFILAGHTDAKGGDSYNQSLSERRADAVKHYLTNKYRIDSKNLVTVGYGKMQLKNSSDPFAAENRRVQVVNVAAKAER
jgi:outer membrane protein OmpA-like peptidoglycan-associated protein